jgi:hypothetical protein
MIIAFEEDNAMDGECLNWANTLEDMVAQLNERIGEFTDRAWDSNTFVYLIDTEQDKLLKLRFVRPAPYLEFATITVKK